MIASPIKAMTMAAYTTGSVRLLRKRGARMAIHTGWLKRKTVPMATPASRTA